MKDEKIWIYNSETKKWSQLSKSSEKLDFDWPHNSPGTVKFTFRRDWVYVHWGETKEEILQKYNRYDNEKIEELKKQIESLEKQKLKI